MTALVPEGVPQVESPARPNALALADVQPERLRWLSRGRLAAGKLTLLDGDPGLGKSTLLCDWAARLSRGWPLPDGEPGDPRGVLVLSAEDGLADTIRPRLEAAGADLTRVVALLSVPDGTPAGRPPAIPGDVDAIAALVTAIDAALVVIDPLLAYLDGACNSFRDQDVRRALAPLAAMAEATGAAVILVRHLNKGSSNHVLYRGGGSIGIIGAARCGLLLAADPDDPDRRVLAPTKSNLARPPAALAFCLEPVAGGDVARVRWLGESPHQASTLLAPPDDESRAERETAKAWLRQVLADGPLPMREVERQARLAGIAAMTLRRARRELGVCVSRQGFGAGSCIRWALPPGRGAGGPRERGPRPRDDQHVQSRPRWEDDRLWTERTHCQDPGDALGPVHGLDRPAPWELAPASGPSAGPPRSGV